MNAKIAGIQTPSAEERSETARPPLFVRCAEGGNVARAHELAARLGLPFAPDNPEADREGTALVVLKEGLALSDGTLNLAPSFVPLLSRAAANRVCRELIVRAAKPKRAQGQLTAVDATAGLGEDALLLAAAGFQVTLFERNPVIAALLEDALAQASSHPQLAPIVGRMSLIEGDSAEGLARLGFQPDAVVLDPMFPERSKSAAVKKKLQLIGQLEQPCEDEEALFDAAQSTDARKIVVKRPLKGPWLANRKPDYTLSGKAIRYDCYARGKRT